MNDPKFVPTLGELDGTRRGTWNRGQRNEFATGKAPATKARESWHVLGIMSEFIEAAERLADIRPAVSIFGSARIPAGTAEYILAERIGRLLADSGFAVISGGGPGLMEAANKGAFEGKALDELTEVLTLIQTGKTRVMPIVLVGSAFWSGLIDWMRDQLSSRGLIRPDDLDLMQIVDEAQDVIDTIFGFYERRSLAPTSTEFEQMLYL